MKNFDWTQFTRKIHVKAPIQKLYDAWAKPIEIERWFLEKAVYEDSTNQTLQNSDSINKGLRYKWNWHLYDITEEGTIEMANGTDEIHFTFAGNCLVIIKLEEAEEGTIVSITQKNIPTDDDSKRNIRLGCDQGWSFYLVNLKSIYEGGLDLRNKNPNLKPMLNN